MARDIGGSGYTFWWDEWPEHTYNDFGEPYHRGWSHERVREQMHETFTLAFEQGITDPATFFDRLQELGFEIYSEDWDEWRDWYNAI